MILAVAVHVVEATGLWRDVRFFDNQAELDIWASVDGWSVTVTTNLILLRPGDIAIRARS